MKMIAVPAVLESLDEVGRCVLEAAAEAGLSRKATYHLRLAVDEVATNIITHGYEEAGLSGEIVVSSEVGDETLTVTLEDTATPFDPRGRPVPEQIHEAADERPLGGLGVFLALKSVDSFDYQHDGTRNRNIFVMNRPSLEAVGGDRPTTARLEGRP